MAYLQTVKGKGSFYGLVNVEGFEGGMPPGSAWDMST